MVAVGSVSRSIFSLRFGGEKSEFGIFGCAVAVAVRLVRYSAMWLRTDGAKLN